MIIIARKGIESKYSGGLPEDTVKSETQKYVHVIYFWNGNKSEKFDEILEYFKEVPSIPELSEIVECLGLMEYIDICISSANVGFEKPNPKIFQHAIEMAGNPEIVWMVGDSIKLMSMGLRLQV